jgi:hypothetical protein
MKKLMILGGLLGFLISAVLGLMQDCSGPSILWRASVSAAVGGGLLRWWSGIWIRGLRESHVAKLNATPNPISTVSGSPGKP